MMCSEIIYISLYKFSALVVHIPIIIFDVFQDSPREALETFNNLLSKNMKSPRATYGRAAALSDIAKLESSNQILEQSMHVLEVLLSNPDTPDALLLKGGLDLAKKQHFRGKWTLHLPFFFFLSFFFVWTRTYCSV